jgi:hypothetical protein
MKHRSDTPFQRRLTVPVLFVLSSFALSAFAVDSSITEKALAPTVPRASCGPDDRPETALQGQVPAYIRAAGFKGFNCNLQLVGQVKGDGANWQSAEFKDRAGHICGYHGTSISTANRTSLGVSAVDVTNAANPTATAHLTTTSMLDPWESLKVNDRRQLLAADNGHNGGGGPEVDIYDISLDCRSPQLLSSIAVGKADGSTGIPATVLGHEGNWAPDGLTYYIGDLRSNGGRYYAVDTTDPVNPKLIAGWKPPVAIPHGLSVSDDGNIGYFVAQGSTPVASLNNPAVAPSNGLLVYDLSQIQARVPNPQVPLIGQLLWKDGANAQHTIPVKIGGKPYLIFVDEGGSGGLSSMAQATGACAAGMPPFPMARIIDIADPTNPTLVSRVTLEINSLKACSMVLPDIVGLSLFTYGTHYCSVDNRQNATTLACGSFNSGIRVFDIRNPLQAREIAYYNPAGTTTPSPGSNHVRTGGWVAGGPDWCSAQIHMDAARGTLWTTCQDNGLLVLKFSHGVWPFPETTTPPGQQN